MLEGLTGGRSTCKGIAGELLWIKYLEVLTPQLSMVCLEDTNGPGTQQFQILGKWNGLGMQQLSFWRGETDSSRAGVLSLVGN